MKKYLLLLLTFLSLTTFAQIEVKEGSFHKIQGYVMLEKEEHVDMNNAPMALIKISTENITAEQRRKFTFRGNAITYFDVIFEPGEIHLYISAAAATFLEIIHDDYGKTEYTFPETLCGYCGYEMVVQYKPYAPNPEPAKPNNNFFTISVDQNNAAIFVDDKYLGNGFAEIPLQIGREHTYRVECDLYHTESGTILIEAGDPVEKVIKLRPAYGFINVNTTPEQGAMVYIDGKNVGKTPYKSGKMASGTYTIKVLKTMYNPVEKTFTITDGNTTEANLNMSSNYVNVTINTEANSKIFVDEEYKGTGSWSGRLSDGIHFVEVKKDNHKTRSQNIELVLGKDMTIDIKAPEPIYGFLELRSTPTRADIYIDGQHVGQTPRVLSDLLIGSHELRIQKQGCSSIIKTINIKEGETLVLNETLQTGAEVTIKTDKVGDMVYVDGDYIGLTPVYCTLPLGTHKIRVERNKQVSTKTIEVNANGDNIFEMIFGKMIRIESSAKGDDVYVDGVKVGKTPVDVDMSIGKHFVEVKRGKHYCSQTLHISKTGQSIYYMFPKKEDLGEYLDNGINFITINAAYSVAPQTSFGLTFGQVRRVGWYVSAMSDFSFMLSGKEWNQMVNEHNMFFTGKSNDARFSLTAGFICKLFGPLDVRVGAGYGARVKCWEVGENWYEYPDDTYKGADLSAGIQLNLKGCVLTADAVTTNFKTLEVKVGIGFDWKKD